MIGSRKQDTRTIGGFELTTIQLPSVRGSRLRVRLLKLLAPAGSALAGVLKGKSPEDLKTLDVGVIAPALMAIATQLDDGIHDSLMLQLLVCSSVVVDGPAGKIKVDLTSMQAIDQAFGGDVEALWAAARVSLEVNLGGFFDGATGTGPGELPAPTP